jgi:hypothetical protein
LNGHAIHVRDHVSLAEDIIAVVECRRSLVCFIDSYRPFVLPIADKDA